LGLSIQVPPLLHLHLLPPAANKVWKKIRWPKITTGRSSPSWLVHAILGFHHFEPYQMDPDYAITVLPSISSDWGIFVALSHLFFAASPKNRIALW